MKLVSVDALPDKRAEQHDLQKLIEEFINCESKIVKIDFGEHDYKSSVVCYRCFIQAAKRSGYGVKVRMRQNDVYLVKE